MKIIYDPQVDVLSIQFNDLLTLRSEKEKDDLIFDYDKDGNLVKLEILNASQRITNPQTIEYSVKNLGQANQHSLSLEQRKDFLKLPLEERRRILAQQATDMVTHYQQNVEWKEFLLGDIIDY
ncbi:DUF2283 domain-containing protein [Oscillatoria salina]|uniref:DUF2283 domain-containing protein n=1 Tax=Oscillatoria salina TaxID=331517 RepID=UPI0013BCDD4E|nr:DUF2283 domain-containing protein [Oscillatoria salina]MBZ8180557.1 DUF2283 domain-containing protein [Oscillatoria salina IIICB1]NET90251.1 DUF2283 domain-containing protein [Kamptonema sp. SIO1D9]